MRFLLFLLTLMAALPGCAKKEKLPVPGSTRSLGNFKNARIVDSTGLPSPAEDAELGLRPLNPP
jgi:hypothetical protein